MTTIEYWIQIENHAWDAAPNNIDRMTGQDMQTIPGGQPPATKTLTSPETGVVRNRTMYKPLDEDALILRRYTANWAAPDDRKVNPWDLNERDPTDNGTMGTIPGPVIECEVGDTVSVHFRNRDHRSGKDLESTTHSLHPHGFVFANIHDGAYPLSPPDPNQPVGAQAALWASVGVTGFKKGDRVPPDADFTYTWNTIGWPTTAGVWLYHDHSICDMENVQLGAIGIIVIHNRNDQDDVLTPDLPGGSPIGRPISFRCFPFPRPTPILPHQLELLARDVESMPGGHMADMTGAGSTEMHATEEKRLEDLTKEELLERARKLKIPGRSNMSKAELIENIKDHLEEHSRPKDSLEPPRFVAPVADRLLQHGDMLLQLDVDLKFITHICLPFYLPPPDQAQYLLLFHNLGSAGMCINGRKYLGNTPTVIAGQNTKMRFGIVGMGNVDGFHTFHLHGHRWVIPGPDGADTGTIQNSPQVTAVSQFEDTRTFGPANSFNFTINPGSFMRSEPPLGEWHMHCHVLVHMMDGMMGSLLKIAGGGLALGLPRGVPCPADGGHGDGTPTPTSVVVVKDTKFTPNSINVSSGSTLIFDFQETFHTVKTVSTTMGATPITINNGGGDLDPVSPIPQQKAVTISGMPGAQINYQCGIHTTLMTGTIHIV